MSMFSRPPASVTIPPMFVQQADRERRNYVAANGEYDEEEMERRNNEHLLRVVVVILRGLSSIFAFLCFVITLTVKDFHETDSFNYVVAMSVLAMVYNVVQIVKGINELANEEERESMLSAMPNGNIGSAWGLVDFVGDQVVSYMVLSGASAGIAATNEGRQGAGSMAVQGYYEKAGAASSMLIVAFMAMLFPTLLSFHRLSQIISSSSS